MNTYISNLSSVTDCQSLIDITTSELTDLQLKYNVITRRQQKVSLTNADLSEDVQALQARYDALTASIPTMQEGVEKEDAITLQIKTHWQLRSLNKRIDNYDEFSQAETYKDTEVIQGSIDKLQAVIVDLQARLAQLAA